MANRIFKLEIDTDGQIKEKISFGPRIPGDVGRDIMVIKYALGIIESYSELINSENKEEFNKLGIDDPNEWFDCVEGKPVTSLQAATFDRSLQNYVKKFQIENQFFMLCYYFTKFAIPETLVEKNSILTVGTFDSPINEVIKQKEVASWVKTGINQIYLSGGKIGSIKLVDNDMINRYKNHSFLSNQIDLIANMYNSEFGTIGEATLAVMHGFLPRTKLFNKGYQFDPEIFSAENTAYDLVLTSLFESFASGGLSQALSDVKEKGIVPAKMPETGEENREDKKFQKYRNQVSLSERIDLNTDVPALGPGSEHYQFIKDDFVVMMYNTSSRTNSFRSILYQSVNFVSERYPRPENISAVSNKDYSDSLKRIHEPDPATNPGPFQIDEQVIGYFYDTSYTLENLPPLPPPGQSQEQKTEFFENSETIRMLEDAALAEVLNNYGKPQIFYLNTRDKQYQEAFIGEMSPFFPNGPKKTEHDGAKLLASYAGDIPNEEIWVLTTRMHQQTSGIDENSIQFYDQFERSSRGNLYKKDLIRPLIKFVEFRTPSFRPGDTYKAKFFINKAKLDYIKDGHQEQFSREELQQLIQSEKQSYMLGDECNVNMLTGSTSEDNKRRYEEYRAIAEKQKREIARAVRETMFENVNAANSNTGTQSQTDPLQIKPDLGVFGKLDINPIKFIQSTDNLSEAAQMSLGNLYQNTLDKFVSNPDLSNADDLTISYPVLKQLTKFASDNLKRAYDNALVEKFKFTPSDYNGARQALLLTDLPIELKTCIVKYKKPLSPQFDFNDGVGDSLQNEMSKIGAGAAPTDTAGVSSLSRFAGAGSDIRFTFKGTPGGLKITKITAGNAHVTDPAKIKEFPSLSDPITVAYLAQIYDMTGGKPSALNIISELLNPLDSFFGACEDIGVGKKSVGYLRKFTPGLKADDSEYDPIKLWYEEEIEGPFNAWYNNSKSNLENMFDSKFNQDQFLALLGKECNLKMLYREFGKKLSLSALLCNLFKCLKLPAININIPDLTLPPIDRLDIFGWYRGLIETMIKKFIEILVRLLCTFLRYIIDLLNFPFCEEQLRDQLYGEFASTSPIVQAALVDALSDIGISSENNEGAKKFIDDALSFLTGQEICSLLRGETVDAAAMSMLLKLAKARGLEDLNSQHSILKFFNSIGIFIPDEFCDDLEAANWIIATTDCEETTSYIDQLRKRMLAGDASEEDIKKAQELLEGNLKDEAEKFQTFGEEGLAGLLPDVVKFGDPNAIVSDIPGNLKQQTIQSLKSVFETAKMGYLSSLSNFGPSLFVNNARITTPKDEDFDETATLGLRTILENLKNYSLFLEDFGEQANEEQNLIKQLNLLHMIYEVSEESPGGARVVRSYKLGKVNGRSASYNPRDHLHLHYYPDQNPWVPLTEQQVAAIMEPGKDDPCLKPIGYSEYEYYEVDDDGRPKVTEKETLEPNENNQKRFHLTSGQRMSTLDREPPSSIEIRGYTLSNLNDFSFQRNYLVERKAEQLDAELPAEERVFLDGLSKQVLLTAIDNRIKRMQSDLLGFLNRVSKPIQGEEYLGGISDLFTAANETMLEGVRARNRGAGGIIRAVSNEQEEGSLLLNISSGGLRTTVKYREFPSVFTPNADPYSIELYNDNMFRRTASNPIILEYCDTIPGPDPSEPADEDMDSIYRQAVRGLPSGLYTRRELFARKIMSSMQGMLGNYYPNRSGDTATYYNLLNPTATKEQSYFKRVFSGKLYSNSMEGVFEQVFFGLRNSKIYDLDRYYPGLEKRVSGETNYDASSGCYKNRFNVSQLSILSFEKVITDEIGKQLSIELAKPENAPQNIDYNKPGPIEKALQNVCFIGFVRICLVELLLKGALAYSVWDFEGVFDEPMMHGFIYEYIKSELNRKEPMRQNWEERSIAISGIDNPEMALKKIVRNQSMKMLDLSKKIYENRPSDETDYKNWYSEIFIPQTHISRNISIRGGTVATTDFRIDLEANISQAGANEPRTAVSDKIYWSHPLLDRRNIISKSTAAAFTVTMDAGAQETQKKEFQQLPSGNDPFFHIEHLVKVTGPLASVESLVIPGSVLTEEILRADASLADDENANWEHYRRITTYVQSSANRIPARMNIMDARDRTNLFQVDPNEYGFDARPSLPAAARGASQEAVVILDENGRIPENKYKHATELFHIEDFKEAIDFKVSDENLKKLEHHLEGLLSYVEPDNRRGDNRSPGPIAYHTYVKEMDGKHPSALRAPAKFIKHTRRVIRFKGDFVSHNVGDLCDIPRLEEYHQNLFSPFSATVNGYVGSFEEYSENAGVDYTRFSPFVTLVSDTTKYRIVGGNAHNYYTIRDLLNIVKEEERNAVLDNPSYNIEHSVYTSDIPRDINFNESVDDLLEQKIEKIIYGKKTEGVTSADTEQNEVLLDISKEIQKDYDFKLTGDYASVQSLTTSRSEGGGVKKGFRKPGLIGGFPTIKKNRARVTLSDDTNPETETNSDGNELVDQITTRKTESEDSEVVIYRNPIGTFDTEEEYENAKNLTYSFSNRPASGNRKRNADPVYVKPREEHWVETIYEFSGDSAILAGIYGSHTIGETFDPAVLNFKPSTAFITAWGKLTRRITDFFGHEAVRLYQESPHYSYGRTFWAQDLEGGPDDDFFHNMAAGLNDNVSVDYGGLREAPYNEHASVGLTGWSTFEQAQVFLRKNRHRSKPLIARPMGIDKHTNMRLTSKLLIRSNVRYDLPWDRMGLGNVPQKTGKELYLREFAPFLALGGNGEGRSIRYISHYEGESNRMSEALAQAVADNGVQFNRQASDLPEELKVLMKNQPIWCHKNLGGMVPSFDSGDVDNNPQKQYHLTGYRDICKYVHKKPLITYQNGGAEGRKYITLSYNKTNLLPPNIYKVPIRVMVTQIYVEGEVVSAFARVLPPKYIRNLSVRPAPDSDDMPSEVLENMAALNRASQKITSEYTNLLSELNTEAKMDVDNIEQELQLGDLPKSKQFAIQSNHFSQPAAGQTILDKMLTFPQFTQDFHINFEPNLAAGRNDRYRMSSVDINSSHQYCSIERIYSEAFHLEVESNSWNSEEELDLEFRTDRGGLLRRVDTNLDGSYDYLGTDTGGGMTAAITHLNSLHFFYQTPPDRFLGGAGDNALSVKDFHRTIFSLNSILQPFLRYRSANSLWGMLTATNPEDVVPGGIGYGGKQRWPLGLSTVSGGKIQPWTIAHNRKASQKYFPSKTQSQRNQYYGWKTEITETGANALVRSKPAGSLQQDIYQHRFEKGLYPAGAMVLYHNWSENGAYNPHDFEQAKYTYRHHVKKRVRGDRKEESDIRNWLYNIEDTNDSDFKMWNAQWTNDGWGQYYVNYNRHYSFPMHNTGTQIFVADGKISFDDLSIMLRTAIISLFKKSSLLLVANENPYDTLVHVMDVVQMIFQDRNGILDTSNYAFFMEELSTLDPPAGEKSFDFSGITFDSELRAEDFDFDRIRVINSSIRDDAKINDLIDMILSFLTHLVERVAFRGENRIVFDNVSPYSIFSNDHSALTQLVFMKRFVENIKSSGAPESIKIILLWFISGYQVTNTIRQSYQSLSSQTSDLQGEDTEKHDWALACMTWFVMWLGFTDTGRMGDIRRSWPKRVYISNLNSNPDEDAGAALPKEPEQRIFKGWQGNTGYKLPDSNMTLLEAIRTMAFHVADHYHYYHGGRDNHNLNWRWRVMPNGGTRNEIYKGEKEESHYWSICGSSRQTGVFPTKAYYEQFLPDPTQRLGRRPLGEDYNFNVYLQKNLSYDDIITAVTTIYADFVLGSTGNNSPNVLAEEGYHSPTLHRHLLGGVNIGSAEVNQPGYTFPGIVNALRMMYDHKDNTIWTTRNPFVYQTRGEDPYYFMIRMQQDGRKWLLKTMDSGKLWIEEANEKFYMDQYETVRFEPVVTKLVDDVKARNKNGRQLHSKVENDMVRAGRLEYLYTYLDMGSFRSIMRSKYFQNHIKGVSLSVDNDNEGSYAAHKSNLLKIVKTSKLAALGHTTTLLRKIINNDIFEAYQTYGMDSMTFRYLSAMRTYTGLPQTVESTMFDGAAKINDKIVDGLFTMSKIDQVSRLVINFPNPAQLDNTGNLDRSFLKSHAFQVLSEEQRSILMTAVEKQEIDNVTNTGNLEENSADFILSVPVVSYSEPMSKYKDPNQRDNFLVDCYQLPSLVSDFNKKIPWMSQQLMGKDDSKLFLNYIFPTRRFQALATIFSTTSLSAYSTMPSLMETPKSSIAFLMGMTGMNPKERMDMMSTLSQGELYKGLMDTQTSVPRALECFPFPFSGEFLEQFMDMLVEQIKQFPAILFRGLANTIDPAYREMKMHWDECRIKNLTYSGLKPFTANKRPNIVAGTHGDNADRNRKYAPLISTTAADLGYSVGMLFANPSKAAKGLLHTTRNLTGYIYKGPLSLFDGAFQFQVPCADIDLGWPDNSSFNLGRYGHPLTPLTLLALSMPELKGDKRLRDLNGGCADDRSKNKITRAVLANSRFCDEEEDPPFGPIPNPENINDNE